MRPLQLAALFALSACSAARVPDNAAEPAPTVPPPVVDAATASPPAAAALHVADVIAEPDRVRIAEAFRLAEAIGDALWPGWSAAPFAFLLVTPEREFLLRHPHPPAAFAPAGFDSLLQSDVFVRPRVFPPTLLATFPLEGVPTIVIGPAGSTGKSSTAWVLTVLHEHFHQLQMSHSGYFSGVEALGLSRGDQTGMWMLNYAFPYDSAAVQASFAAMTHALANALDATAPEGRQASWDAARGAREQLRRILPADDDRYLSFQMWQEGVARYTELQVARWASARFTPSRAFQALGDATSFDAAADSIEAGIRAGLGGNPLGRARRVAFYPAGAATASVLDEVAPGWRARYADSGFSLDGAVLGHFPGTPGGP